MLHPEELLYDLINSLHIYNYLYMYLYVFQYIYIHVKMYGYIYIYKSHRIISWTTTAQRQHLVDRNVSFPSKCLYGPHRSMVCWLACLGVRAQPCFQRHVILSISPGKGLKSWGTLLWIVNIISYSFSNNNPMHINSAGSLLDFAACSSPFW